MSKTYIPEGYRSLLNLRQTQMAIKKVKDFFERATLVLKNVGYILFNPVNICPRHITCLIDVGGGGESIKNPKKLHQVPAFIELMNSWKYPNQMGK